MGVINKKLKDAKVNSNDVIRGFLIIMVIVVLIIWNFKIISVIIYRIKYSTQLESQVEKNTKQINLLKAMLNKAGEESEVK